MCCVIQAVGALRPHALTRVNDFGGQKVNTGIVTRRGWTPLRWMALVLIAALIAAACSEAEDEGVATTEGNTATTAAVADDTSPDDTSSDDTATDDTGSDTSEAAAVDDGSIVFQFAGEEWHMGTVPSAAVAADPDAEPIRLGMLNIENVDGFSFPELRGAAEAAAAFVNAELGGVDGHPIEIVPCFTSLSPEQSQTCAQEMVQEGVVALVGGIDIMSQGSVPVLEQNALPMLGGIPAGLPEMQSSFHFYFSGGTPGAMAGMLAHAEKNGAQTALIAHADLPSFTAMAADFAKPVGESLGIDIDIVKFPLVGADMLPVLTAAADADVDALIMNAADTACVPIMELAVQLELRAQIYLVGACAGGEILDEAGSAAAGVIFSGEGPADADAIGGSIFDAVVERYATGPAEAAGTVSFRGFMNMYSVLVELGFDNISSESITEFMRTTVDRPSFWGHPYTCDGQRIPGLQALCAPEQSLFMSTGVPGEDIVFLPEDFAETDGWIETDELYAAALG